MKHRNGQGGLLQLFVIVGVSVLLTYYYTEYIWTQAGYWKPEYKGNWIVSIITGFGIAACISILLQIFLPVLGIFSGGQQNENISLRRLKGMFAHCVAIAMLIIAEIAFVKLPEDNDAEARRAIVGFILGIIIWVIFLKRGKRWISTITQPVRAMRKTARFGKGGSASFAKMVEEWGLEFKKGAILLGASLYGSKREPVKIGVKDDRHLLTIASSRSGKGRSAIIPNLITWPHSALVIDPKGTNSAVTAARRGKGGGRVKESLGQNVHVVDPFDIVDGIDTAHFNPLEEIDLLSITVKEDIELLADAMVVPETGKGAEHWNEGSRIIIAGIIAQLLTRKKSGKPTLMDMRWFLNQPRKDLDEFFESMAENTEAGCLPMAAASMYRNAGESEWGAFATTITRNTKWIDSKAMEQILDKSDFGMADLKDGNTTIYIVLPPNMLEEHKRFMRLFVNMACLEMPRGRRAENPVLFVLDEFFSLGPLTQLEKAAGLMGGYNMKLWPIVQNLTQLKGLYHKNWETFISNAGTVQFFSVNDLETGEYLQRLLGQSAREIEIGGSTQRVITSLSEAEELGRALGRDEGKQIIVRSDKAPLYLRRLNYDKVFSKKQYNIDPDHR